MNYKAFYRTYRPTSFDEVVGQDHIVKTLVNLIKMDKIFHGYLFSGPRGTGKTSIAKIFANAINCIHANNKEDICAQSLSILSMMISFLDLKSLWGYGFPAISIYSFILRSFLEYHQIPVSFI